MSKKLIALALALTFALSFTVKGATVEELQAQIAALLAQIQALQAQLGQQKTTTGGYCFTTDLKQGMTSNDVKNLQIVLGVTPTSGYFGPLTLAAVKKFQAENGIRQTGYVGPLTRQALNSKYCTPPTTLPTTPTTPTTTVAPSYGTLSVTSYPVSNPQSMWYPNQTYEVLAAQYKATGSDITLRKVAVQITSPTFPWTSLSTISLWDGTTKLTEVPVTQANLIQNSFGTNYTLNISGLNWIIPNGQQKVLTMKVTLLPAINVSAEGDYSFSMPSNGVIYSDTAGVIYTSIDNSIGPTTSTIKASSQSASFTVSVNANNPIENNIIGSTSDVTRQTVLVFDVQNNSTINATFNSATSIVTQSAGYKVISLELWDGSNLVASKAVLATTSPSTVTWENFTLPVAANTTKTLTVKAVIAQLTTDYAGGDTVTVSSPSLTGIDVNSNLVSAGNKGITGNTQHIYYKAPSFGFIGGNVSVTGSNPNGGHPNDIADASLTFTVTANNSDIYIPTQATSSSALTVTGGPATNTVSTTWSCNSPADNTTNTNFWRIPAGTTASCTMNYHAVNTGGTAGYYQLVLNKVTWATTATVGSGQTYGFTTFKTNTFYVGN